MTDPKPIYGAILAAGYGSRMSPLTDVLPKPLLPFLNTPIIAYTIDHLRKAGVKQIGVNLHHLGHMIPPVLEQLAQTWQLQGHPMTFTTVHEPEIRGTAGGIAGIWDALGRPDGTLVVFNGDPVMNIPLANAIAEHRTSGAEVTMVVRPVVEGHPAGVWVDPQGHVCRLRDVSLAEGGEEREFMGVHLLEPSALERIETAARTATSTCMVADVYLPMLREGLTIRTTLVDDFWVALDNPGLLLGATREVLEQPDRFDQAPLGPSLG
ncbi:MAG: NDP-sugar synthase, partial [Myxococcota bacterium]